MARGLVYAHAVVLACLVLIVSCGGGSANPAALQDDIGTPAAQQSYKVDPQVPAVEDLPRETSAIGEYFQLDSPISTGGYYTSGEIWQTDPGEMAWATYQLSGYSEQYPPSVLRLYFPGSTSDFWVGLVDFGKGKWRWLPATKDDQADAPYHGREYFEIPNDGKFFRESDGAAFVTILIQGPETSEYVKFHSARLATRHGVFYETNYTVDSADDAERLRGYSMMYGKLTIDCGEFSIDALSDLLYVDSLTLTNATEADCNSLENLQIVNETLRVTNGSYSGPFELVSLAKVGELTVSNGLYTSSSFPDLTQADSIAIQGSIDTEAICLPALETVGNLEITGSISDESAIKVLNLDSLVSADTISISRLGITQLIFVNLKSATRIEISNLPLVERISSNMIMTNHVELNSIENWLGNGNFRLDFREVDGSYPCLVLDSLYDLESLDCFDYCPSGAILNSLVLSECYDLTSLSGLEWIAGVKNLYIGNCSMLSDATVLDGVMLLEPDEDSEDGSFSIISTGLTTLPQFSISTNFSCRHFIIKHNQELTSIANLAGVTHLSDGFIVRNNDALTSLTGFDDLEFAGWKTEIRDNELLADLDALSSLRFMATDDVQNKPVLLNINLNPALTDISGIGGMLPDPVSRYVINGDLIIACNEGLPNGDQAAWDVVNAWGGDSTVSGEISIHDNGL